MHSVTVNGKTYISSRRAAKIAGYTTDYVGQLCRSEKLQCTRVGRVWYVTEESVLNHKQAADQSFANSRNGQVFSENLPTPKKVLAASPSSPVSTYDRKTPKIEGPISSSPSVPVYGDIETNKKKDSFKKFVAEVSPNGVVYHSQPNVELPKLQKKNSPAPVTTPASSLDFVLPTLSDVKTKKSVLSPFRNTVKKHFKKAVTHVDTFVEKQKPYWSNEFSETVFVSALIATIILNTVTLGGTAYSSTDYQNAYGNAEHVLADVVHGTEGGFASLGNFERGVVATLTGQSTHGTQKALASDGASKNGSTQTASVGSIFGSAWNAVVAFFSPSIIEDDYQLAPTNPAPAPAVVTTNSTTTIVIETKPAVNLSTSVGTPPPKVIIEKTPPQQIITERVQVGDISSAEVDQKIQALSDRLTSEFDAQLASLSTGTGGAITNVYQEIAGSQVGNLTNTILNTPTINNPIVNGGTFSGPSFPGGIDLTSGCFSINGVCIGTATSSSSGTLSPGLAGQTVVYPADGDTVTATSSLFIAPDQFVGIGTTSPTDQFSVGGNTFLGGNLTVTGNVDIENLTSSSTQCLQADANGNISGTGGPCGSGGGAVNQVKNTDGSLTISPTSGIVIASLNTANPNIWSGLQTFTNFLTTGSSTLQNFTAQNSTTTNATTTNFFATNSNATNSTVTNSNSTNSTIANLTATNGQVTNLTSTNGTTTNATSTNIFVTNLTAANLTLLGGQTTVNSTSTNATTTNFFTSAITAVTGTINNFTSTLATILGLNVTNSTTTNATTTNSFATNSVATNLTTANSTTTNFAITGVPSSILKTNASGGIVAAIAGTDYEVPLTFNGGLTRSGNTVSLDNSFNKGFFFSTTSANFWGSSQGFLTGNQNITLTGDVTGSGTTNIVTTIGAGKVSNVDLANSSLTVTAGTGLSGGGSVALGSAVTLNNTGLLSLAQTSGSAQTGTITLGTSTDSFNGLNFNELITNAGGVFNFSNNVTGTLDNTGLTNSSVTINTTGPLTGGGAVALGGALTLACPSCITSTFANPFTPGTFGSTITAATTTAINDLGGLISTASSTLSNLTSVNSTSTNATSTNFNTTNEVATNSTVTNLTASNLTVGSLNGVLKATGGVVGTAAAGTDYEVPLTFSTGLTRSVNTITVNTSQNISTLSNLTTNGLVRTSGGTGALSVDTTAYLSGIVGVPNGGTGSTTLTGILIGGGATPVQSLTVGSGLSLTGTTLSAVAGGSGTVNAGTTGQIPYYAANGTTVSATSSVFIASSGNVGIGTTSPSQALSVQGNELLSGNLNLGNLTATGTATIGGALGVSSLATLANLLVTGSSTLQNFTALNSTTTNATSTNFFATSLTTSGAKVSGQLSITGVASCAGGQALQTDGSGNITCGTITGGSVSSAGGWTTNNIGRVTLSTTTDLVAIGATSTPYAKLAVISGAAGTTTLALVPSASQTANILDVYGTSGSLASVIAASGNFGIGSTTPGSLLSVGSTNGINFTTATSTFSSTGGINIISGCFAVNGICVGGTGPSSAYAFTPGTFGSTPTSATSTAINDLGGLISTASSTLSNLTSVNSTSTNATTTNLSTGNLAITGLSSSLLAVNSSGQVVATSTIGNAQLQNSSLTVTAGTGLSGGGAVSLGGSITLNNTGVLSLAQTSGSAQTGALTLGTSSVAFNGLTLGTAITNSAGAFTFTPTISGTLANTGLANSSVTINTTGPLSGGGAVSLGGTLTLACASCSTFGYNFTPGTFGSTVTSATSTAINDLGGLISTASSTLSNLTSVNSTSTNATSTNFFATVGHFATGVIDNLSSTLATFFGITTTNLVATNSTTTNATTTNLVTTSLTSYTAPIAPSFTATSTTATSTFAGGITGPNNFTVQQGSGNLGVGTSSPLGSASIVGQAGQTNPYLTLSQGSSTATINPFLNVASSSNFELDGGVVSPVNAGSLLNGVNGSILSSANDVFVSGNYAYVVSGGSGGGALDILNISNPAAPVSVGTISNGTAALNNPNGIFVSGNYAYIADAAGSAFEIVDVSNPAKPVHKGSLTNGTGGADLNGAQKVYVSGNYAYVASLGSNALEIINISNPANPVHAGALVSGTGGALLGGAASVFVSGNYAYVAADTSNALDIVDISNPTNPVQKGSISNGGTTKLSQADGVFVSGNYAYVAAFGSNALEIVDVSNPAKPVHVSSISTGGGALLNGPGAVFVSGNYAYVASNSSNALDIVNISNPLAPVQEGVIANGNGGAKLSGPNGVFIAGNYAYLAAGTSGALDVVDVGGGNISNIQIGSAKVDNLQVNDYGQFNQGLSIVDGLSVGTNALIGGGLTVSGLSSTTATNINPTSAVFLGGNVGIGTTSPFATLSVAGSGYFGVNLTTTNIIATGTATSTNLAITGLSNSLLAVNSIGQVVATTTVGNGQLQNSSLTINTTGPLTGGGAVSLGGTLTLACASCSTFTYPFTSGTFGSTNTFATTTAFNDTAGIISTASSTLSQLTSVNSTSTNATSTNFFATVGHFATGVIDNLSSTLATFFGITTTNLITINSTSTNATTTNLVATNITTANITATGTANVSGLTTTGNLLVTGSSTLQNFTGINATTTSATTTNFSTTNLAVTGSATSTFGGGVNVTTGCFAINGACIASGVTINSVSNSDGTLNISTLAGAVTASLNTSHPNVWNALQTFNNASTSQLSVGNTLYVGGTSTTTISNNLADFSGSVGIGSSSPSQALGVQGSGLFSGNLSAANINATGTIITQNLTINGTCTGCGASYFTNSGASTYLSTGTNLGIGTTTPWGQLSVNPNGLPNGEPAFVVGSSSATDFVVANSGNVAIGRQAGSAALSIEGGPFSDNSSLSGELTSSGGWTSAGWTGTQGTGFTHSGGNTNTLSETISPALVPNGYYEVSFTVSGRSSGTNSFNLGGYGTTTANLNNNYSFVVLITGATNSIVSFTPSTSFNGTLSGISVTQIVQSTPLLTLYDSTGADSVDFRESLASLNNLFIGKSAGEFNTVGVNNTAVGAQALENNSTTTSNNNTAVGSNALFANTTGADNSALGSLALSQSVNGSDNTALGNNALFEATSTSGNTAVGSFAGEGQAGDGTNYNTIVDSFMTFIGFQASRDVAISNSTPLTNGTAIGYDATVGCSNCLVLGGTGANAVNVGIGTTSPFTQLAVNGSGFFGGNLTASNITATGTVTDANLVTTNLTATNATTTNLAITGLANALLAVNGSGQVIASSTIGNAQLQNSSLTINTTGPLSGGGAVSLGGTLTLACASCSTSGSVFTPGTFGSTITSATSTAINDLGGLISTASSTLSLLTVTNGTTTNATSTNFNTTNLSTTNLAVTGTATSTFAGGLNLSSGCYAIGGNCLTAAALGAVTSVTNADGSLTVSPTTGAVVVSLNTSNPNTWGALQTFGNIISTNSTSTNATTTNLTASNIVTTNLTINGTCTGAGCGSNFFTNSGASTYLSTGTNLGIGTTTPYASLAVVGQPGQTNPYLTLSQGSSTGTIPPFLNVASSTNFQLDGGAVNPVNAGFIASSTGNAELNNPINVFVSGNYAYVVSFTGGSLQIINISNPANPVAMGSISDGTNGAKLSQARSVYVSGNYAYIVGSVSLDIVDVSNPAHPVQKGVISDGGGVAPYLFGAFSVYVQGNYAYVASQTSGALEIVNISNPANPVHAGDILDGTGGADLASPVGVYVSGSYAYVTTASENALDIVDVSNPTNPVQKGVIVDGSGSAPFINNPRQVVVSGNYAYVAADGSNALEIVDVSNPAHPVHAGDIRDGGSTAPFLSAPFSVFVAGKYAYVVASTDNALDVVDISNPAAPVQKSYLLDGTGGAKLSQASSVFVSGNYAYIAASGNNALDVVDVGGGNISNAQIGSAKVDNLQVNQYAQFNQGISTVGALNVGTNALISGGLTVSGLSSTTASNANPTSAVFLGGNVGIGTTTPFTQLSVNGSGFFGGSLTATNLTATGTIAFPSISGSTQCLQVNTSGVVSGTGSGCGGANFFTNVGSSTYLTTGSQLGIGTTTPWGMLSVAVPVYSPRIPMFAIGSTTGSGATSTPFIVDHIGNVGINTASPWTNLSVSGSEELRTSQLTLATSTQLAGFSGAGFVALTQHYAYVSSDNYPSAGGSFAVYDVTNVNSPVLLKQITNSTTVNGAEEMKIVGKYLYMDDLTGNTLSVFDISNPNNPVNVAELTDSTNLAGIEAMDIVGNYIYAVDFLSTGTTPGVSVIDIADPLHPKIVGTITNPSLSNPVDIRIHYPYAYVTNESDTKPLLSILDISNPTNPIMMATTTPGNAGSRITDVDYYGRYVYIDGFSTGKMYVVDVSNPSAPFTVNTISVAGEPLTVKVIGNNVFTTEITGNTLAEYSLASVTDPVLVASLTDATKLVEPDDIETNGANIFVSLHGNGGSVGGGFGIINGPTLTTPLLNAGTGSFDNLEVTHDLAVNRVIVGTSLEANAVWSVNTSAASNFEAASTTLSSVFMGSLGIGTTSPFAALGVNGSGFFNGNLTAANITATGTASSTNLITMNATTTNATSTNFFTTNASSTNATTTNFAVTGTATSTFGGGINLASGCFAIGGTCLSTGGGGAVSSVSNADGTLTISPTTGAVVASLNLANANTWSGLQQFNLASSSQLSVGNTLYVGGTSTTTINNAGIVTPSVTSTNASTTNLVISGINGSTQCLHVNSAGLVSGTGADCGSGGSAVNSVTNADGSLTISPTSGNVIASLNTSNANVWSALQQFNLASTSQLSVGNTLYVGGTSTTTISNTGIVTPGLTINTLTGSTQCLQVNTSGVVSGTGSACGSGGSNFFTNSGASTYLSTGTNLGIGTTTPFASLAVVGQAGQTNPYLTLSQGSSTATIAPFLNVASSTNFELDGGVTNPVNAGSLATGVNGSLLAGAASVFVQGNYAYVVSDTSAALDIINISNPANPVSVGTLTNGTGGALLGTANGIYVSGNYAYIAADGSNALEIVDVSNPAKPVHKGSLTSGTGGALLASPQTVYVSGNYAYVPSFTSNALEIDNISNPANPVHVGDLVNGTGGALLAGAASVFVQGNYAYVAADSSNALDIIDISNPANPIQKGSISNGGSTKLSNPDAVFVSGNYAYVGSFGSNALEIVDVSNPAKPVHAGSISTAGTALLNGPGGVFVSGNYAYVASNGSNALDIVNISNPTAPVQESVIVNGNGGAKLSGPNAVFVAGNYAYVAAGGSNALDVVDVGGGNVSNIQIGTAKVDNLQVNDFAQFDQGISTLDGLSVGTNALIGGGLTVSGLSSTTATNANPTSAVFLGGNVGIGTTTPFSMLSVAGQVVAQNYVATSTTATSTFAGGITGANGFTVQQTSGNVGIASSSPGSLLSVGGTNGINFSTGTSTFSSTGGINLANGGCFAIAGTCLSGGGASVTSVTNPDGTLTISPTTGAVVASLNLANANTWSALQSFGSLFATNASTTNLSAINASTTNLTLGLTGSIQCLHVNSAGVVSGTGSDCGSSGGGTVNAVSNSDGSLIVTPTTGAVVASLNTANANVWSALQQFNLASTSQLSVGNTLYVGGTATTTINNSGITTPGLTINTITGSSQCLQVNSSGVVSGAGAACGSGGSTFTNSGASTYLSTGTHLGIGTSTPWGLLSVAESVYTPNTPMFIVASSTNTGSTATSSAFEIDGKGNAYFGTSTTVATNDISIQNLNGNTNFINMYGTTGTSIASISSAGNLAVTGITFPAVSSTFTLSASGQTGVNFLSSGNAGDAVQISANNLTGGRGLNVNTTSTGRTAPLGQFTSTASNAAVTGDILFLNQSGALTKSNIINITNLGTGNNIQINPTLADSFVVNSLGYEGIGTSTPWGVLSVATTTYSTNNTNAPLFVIATSSSAGTSTSTPFIVNKNGSVGINQTAPATKLDVNGDITDESVTSCNTSSTALGTDSTGKLICNTGITSDQRLKADITTLSGADALNAVNALNPVSFFWKDPSLNGEGSTAMQFGFIAQQVQNVLPNVVGTTSPTYLTPDVTYTVNYQELIPVAINAIKDVNAVFDATNASTTQPSIISFFQGTSTAAVTIAPNGNVGIGTSTPAYDLQVIGTIGANSFVETASSTQEKDITYLSADDSMNILNTIDGIKISQYRNINESETDALQLGLTPDQAPSQILSADGQGVDLAKFAAFTLAGLQAEDAKLDALTARVATLESEISSTTAMEAAVGESGDGSGNGSGGISMASVIAGLQGFGVDIEQSFTHIISLVVDNFTVGSAAKPTGITLYDKVTGAPYCLSISSGVSTSTPGACDTVSDSGSGSGSGSGSSGGSGTGNTGTSTPSGAAPVITINGDNPAQVALGSSYLDLGASVTDSVSPNIGITTTGTVDTSTVGTYTITYSATDQNGLTGTATRTVNVYDPNAVATSTPPTDGSGDTGSSTPPTDGSTGTSTDATSTQP